MKTKLPFLAIVLLFSISFTPFSASYKTLEIGKEIPLSDVKLKDVSGKSLSLSEIKEENGLLVIFSCNTCPYVKLSESRILDIAKLAMDNAFGVVIINSNEARRDSVDSFDAMQKYAMDQSYRFPYLVDEYSKLADAFGATRTPQCFLFDDKALVYEGAIDDNVKEESNVTQHFLRDAILAVSKGEDVKVKNSKSIGCSIKRVEE